MCTLIKAFKELRSIVKILEDKVNQPENKEIQNIMESQKILDIAMNENSDAIEKINSEIQDLQNDKSKENVHQEDNRKTEKGAKSVNIITEDTVNTKWSADSDIQTKFVKLILREENVTKMYVKTDTQKSVNGGKERVGAVELVVITFMVLLLVMMDKVKLTKVFHVLAARTATTTRDVLCIIMSII